MSRMTWLVSFVLAGLCAPVFARAETLPWQTWADLESLSQLHRGHQSLLRSSHCLDGCRFDRHSSGDWRYLYVDGDEGVIFDERGAGAISRIWMTMGMGTSEPLDPTISIRIYVDDSPTPVVDLPLPSLFDGSVAPFQPPLVGNRLSSSGGNFSYVPISYRTACRVVLVGADEKRIWYQLNFHRVVDADDVVSFTGEEDLSEFADLLDSAGSDPWPKTGTVVEGSLPLLPGESMFLFDFDGAGWLNSLRLNAASEAWEELELTLIFDELPTVQMPLTDFFAVGRGGDAPTRSLLVGLDQAGDLYSYFPMPFTSSARATLTNRSSTLTPSVDYFVRRAPGEPVADHGVFGAELRATEATPIGEDYEYLSLHGEGKIVATFAELGSTSGLLRNYLEGDERIFIDDSLHPSIYGTGVEDYFNGGFYFDMGPFAAPLHGAPYTDLRIDELPTTAMYRVLLTDAMTFAHRIRAGLESGPTSNISMRARLVNFYYRRPQPRLHLWDRFDVGNSESRAEHAYEVDEAHEFEDLDALFEGEPPRAESGRGVYRPPGSATFTMSAHPRSARARLRRRLDAGHSGQPATVLVGGVVAGRFPPVYASEDRRWREQDIDLSTRLIEGVAEIEVIAEPHPVAGNTDTLTAFRYELWADGPEEIFEDGFESGDLSRWTTVLARSH